MTTPYRIELKITSSLTIIILHFTAPQYTPFEGV